MNTMTYRTDIISHIGRLIVPLCSGRADPSNPDSIRVSYPGRVKKWQTWARHSQDIVQKGKSADRRQTTQALMLPVMIIEVKPGAKPANTVS
jgi:hypothetical protein